MATPEMDKRLAALEKGLKAAEDRATAAEAKSAQLDKDLKRTKGALVDAQQQHRAQVGMLSGMRDLHDGPGRNPYENDTRETYDALKRETAKTRDGRAHYYSEGACYLSDNGKPPFTYHPRDSFISLPKDVDPSLTFLPVEIAGKDAQGKLVFVVKGKGADDSQKPDEEDPSNQPVTNTELNARRAAGNQRMAAMGAGSAPVPDAPGSRPSDTEVG